jgi:hypothetical protein
MHQQSSVFVSNAFSQFNLQLSTGSMTMPNALISHPSHGTNQDSLRPICSWQQQVVHSMPEGGGEKMASLFFFSSPSNKKET